MFPSWSKGPASLNDVAEDGRIVFGTIPFAPAVVRCALHGNLDAYQGLTTDERTKLNNFRKSELFM